MKSIVFAMLLQVVATPFIMTHEHVTPIVESAMNTDSWLGEVKLDASIGNYVDQGLMLIFGGIPWQVTV